MHLIDVSSSNWCIYLSFSQVIRIEEIQRGFVASVDFFLFCLF